LIDQPAASWAMPALRDAETIGCAPKSPAFLDRLTI
jgi:hypothetical protein